MKVFIPLVGQFTNVGDSLHRSVLIEWLQESKTLHLYVGAAPDSFMSGLYIDKGAILYRNVYLWLLAALFSVSKSAFVYNPGEITGSRNRFFKELALWPVLSLYKCLRRPVLKVGVDVKSQGAEADFLYRLSNFFTSYTYYRTQNSFDRFGKGEVIPDLGFFRFSERQGRNDKYVAISMRADKYVESADFFDSIASFCIRRGLKVAVVSQVRMDNVSALKISEALAARGCDVNTCLWEDVTTHAQQELLVNDVYLESELVISDRLHVLIAAANNGAVPLCLASYYSDKVDSHFEVIGFKDLVYDFMSMTSTSIKEVLDSTCVRKHEFQRKMLESKSRLALTKADVLFRIEN